MADFSIQREKLEQAVGILNEQQIDLWLTFVRETKHNSDPALGLIYGLDLTWHSALIVTRTGRKIAIVGRYDADNVRAVEGYDSVLIYDQSIKPELLRVLAELNPRQIAINYSESDTAADGLSHGMYLQLQRYLEGTPYELISAEHLLNPLRGRKSTSEINRIRAAVRLTEDVIDSITTLLAPGLSEIELSDFIDAEYRRLGVTRSFDQAVNCGPESNWGHGGPTHLRAAPGHIIHIDMGLVLKDYVSDIQRVWYLRPVGETGIPAPVKHAFDAVRGAIEAAGKVLKPGVKGYEVDAASRAAIVAAGYPEYQHAVGHHIGRTVHDGSTLLGPRWERYGKSPEGLVEVGNCYTLELGVVVPGYGIISVEEDVVVTASGMDYISIPQTSVIVKQL